jgi:hypothetical protein
MKKIRLNDIILDEMARRNPEQNPKINLRDGLKQYKDDPDIYISFTNIDKIGINPSSNYNTPVGIYTYPLVEIWDNIIDNNIPFEGDEEAHHVWVLRQSHNDSGRFIPDLFTKYTSEIFDHDIGLLRKSYGNIDVLDMRMHPPDLVGFYNSSRYDDSLDGLIEYAMDTSKHTYIASKFFNITRLLSILMYYSRNRRAIESASMAWNSILRELGYSGFADKSGKGIIHESEPTQAVFLYRNAFEVVEKLENRKGILKNSVAVIKKLITYGHPIPPEGEYALRTDYYVSKVIVSWLFETYPLDFIIRFMKKYKVKTDYLSVSPNKIDYLHSIMAMAGATSNTILYGLTSGDKSKQCIANIAEITKATNDGYLLNSKLIPDIFKYFDSIDEDVPDIIYNHAIHNTSPDEYPDDIRKNILDYMKDNKHNLAFPDQMWLLELANDYLSNDKEIPDDIILYLNYNHPLSILENDKMMDALVKLYDKTKKTSIIRATPVLVKLIKYYHTKKDIKELKRVVNYGINNHMLNNSASVAQIDDILFDLFENGKDSKYLVNEDMFNKMISKYKYNKNIVYPLMLDAIHEHYDIDDYDLLAQAYLDTFNIEYIASKRVANDVIFNYDVKNKMPKKVYDDMMNKLPVTVLPLKYRNFLLNMSERGLVEGIDAVEYDDDHSFVNYLKNNKTEGNQPKTG